jgi:hypothetical protein
MKFLQNGNGWMLGEYGFGKLDVAKNQAAVHAAIGHQAVWEARAAAKSGNGASNKGAMRLADANQARGRRPSPAQTSITDSPHFYPTVSRVMMGGIFVWTLGPSGVMQTIESMNVAVGAVGMTGAYGLGLAGSVWGLGRKLGRDGSFYSALGGGLAGSSVSLSLLMTKQVDLDPAGGGLLLGVPAAGAVAGYLLSDHRVIKDTVAFGSLLKVDDSGPAFGFPLLFHWTDKETGEVRTQLSLFSTQF